MCCFFFFKQKTAYEVRISDWSSDVCSSDLTGVRVGEQAGLVEHQLAHRGEVLDRRGVAVLGQPLGGDRVAVLRALAEGEEGFVAAGLCAGPGDGPHLPRAEVGRLEACLGLGEGAVSTTVAAEHGGGGEQR